MEWSVFEFLFFAHFWIVQLHELHDLYQKHKNLGKMPCSNANVANTDGAVNPNLFQTSPIEKNREVTILSVFFCVGLIVSNLSNI